METSTFTAQQHQLSDIESLDSRLELQFADALRVDRVFSRALVSFQADKGRPFHRWYKFKEAFSSYLVEYLLERYEVADGPILDPFAGSGTTLFVASAQGLDAHGIELLPIGRELILSRRLLQTQLTPDDLATLDRWAVARPWQATEQTASLNELRITKGAYPPETASAIEHYLGLAAQENERVQAALRFALLSVLEKISYTRKDGQYLRWDYRSGRRQGKKKFDKGKILSFEDAISAKLKELLTDLFHTRQLRLPSGAASGNVTLLAGSCLDVLPTLRGDNYTGIITSPPYCNRYDYTRTYALELALLGATEKNLISLRQQMLSSTVENREKDLLTMRPEWAEPISVADSQELLQAILRYLESQRSSGALNNNGIPRMIRGYFYEMACVIAECVRVLKPGAPLIMVNDNVRYAGAPISVDLILSDFAEKLGFTVERILVLPNGKGNSSQQMGEYGRAKLRKCIYVWRKPRP